MTAVSRGLVQKVRRTETLPYWLVIPTLVYLAVFFVSPMVQAFRLAFESEGGGWTLANFDRMINDADFGRALRFTLLLVVIVVPLQFVVALAMALVVNAKLRFRGVFLYIYLLPLAISDLAAGIVWYAIFTERGYLNTLLEGVGLIDQAIIWINPQRGGFLLGEVMIAELWRSTALVMVVLVAGLQGIPKEYGEAAEVFGAGWFQRLRKVTLPMLKPALSVAILLRTVLAFEVFSTVLAITGRGATVLPAEAWRWQTDLREPNIAASYATLILVLTLAAAVLILRVFRTPREQMVR
ncbi:MAG: carbohydrate ABC transporter permease [Acidimicrobiales bacterium]